MGIDIWGFERSNMINIIYFLILLDSKIDYNNYCKSCHGDAKSFYSSSIKSKDFSKTVDVMMKNYGSEIYSKQKVNEMIRFAKSFKQSKGAKK